MNVRKLGEGRERPLEIGSLFSSFRNESRRLGKTFIHLGRLVPRATTFLVVLPRSTAFPVVVRPCPHQKGLAEIFVILYVPANSSVWNSRRFCCSVSREIRINAVNCHHEDKREKGIVTQWRQILREITVELRQNLSRVASHTRNNSQSL